MVTTKLFTNNTTQAVRLPRDVAFPADVREVEVIVIGQARLIVPVAQRWDFWFDHGAPVSADFLIEREQAPAQDRPSL